MERKKGWKKDGNEVRKITTVTHHSGWENGEEKGERESWENLVFFYFFTFFTTSIVLSCAVMSYAVLCFYLRFFYYSLFMCVCMCSNLLFYFYDDGMGR